MKSSFDQEVERLLEGILGSAARGLGKLGGAVASTAVGLGPVPGWQVASKISDAIPPSSPQKNVTSRPGESSLPGGTTTDAQTSTTTTGAAAAGTSLKSIAPKITDRKIDTVLATTKLQPGDRQLVKTQITGLIRGLKGPITDQQLLDIINTVLQTS